jgi:hypothetical protein
VKLQLRWGAAANVVMHLAGLACAALLLRPGTPLVGELERRAWLTLKPTGWTIGWLAWILCALAIVLFLTLLCRSLRSPSARARTALVMVWLSACVDISCDVAWIAVIPGAASGATFLSTEALLSFLGQTIANGLYSVAVLLLALELPGRLQRALGAATFASGMAMAVAGVTQDPRLLMWSTGPTIGCFCAWTVAATVSAERA